MSSKIGIKIVGSKSKMYFIRLEIKRKLHVVKALQAEVDALVKMLPRNSARPPHEPPIEALTEPNIQRASTAIRQSIVRREHNKVDGWELYYTPSYAYYYNHNTGESEWAETDDGPLYLETSANTANIENDASPVPITRAVSLEWELCHDLEGRPYIYNRRKNISEWVVDYAKDDTLNTFRGDGKEKYDVDNNADSEQIMPEVVLRDHDITAASDPPSTNLTLEYYEDIVEDPNDSKIYYTPEGLGYSYSKVTGLSEWVLEQMQVSS